MTNPFDDEEAEFYVLVNEEGQYSLWPVFAGIPAGWTVVHGKADRRSCVDYVTDNWTGPRPKSLIAATDQAD